MRLLILIALGGVVLGGVFYEDVDLYFVNEFGGTQGSFSVGRSVENLEESMSDNMRNIAGSLGQ